MGLRLALVSVCIIASLAGCAPAAPLTVSAASNVQPAFEEIGRAFTAQTGRPVVFNFGATTTLAQQIAGGAPVDLFAAANTADVEKLARDGLIDAASVRPYAIGRLVLYVAEGAGAPVTRLEDLARPEITRVAIANPERAPYGAAAVEALQAAGVYDAVLPKLIFGENVTQTFQYAETGNVDSALVPLSLTIGKPGVFQPVPESLHQPIVQSLGVVAATRNASSARAFADFVLGPAGQATLAAYGYASPSGETSP
jgi:molybdate transport system substrate-binding protein